MTDSIWTKTFIFLCAAQLLGYAQHFMLAPVLPLFLTQLGAPPVVVGIVLACFAVTSVMVRPLVGHWADRWSEAGVMIAGLLFQAVTCFSLLHSVRPGHGVGQWPARHRLGGFEHRRLLASGADFAGKRNAARRPDFTAACKARRKSFFPPFALWLLYASFGGYRLVFVVTAVFSIAGALTGWAMASSVPRPAKVHGTHEKTDWWREIFHFVEPEIFLPSLLLLWLNLSLPAITNFIILYAKELGIGNFAAYFVVIGATSMLGRPLLGRLSDRIGRARSIAAGFALQVIALVLITVMSQLLGVIICGAIYMLGNAIGSSTTLALAVERADPQRRGKQMATFSVAYPLSYGVGSLITGSAIDIAGYIGMFLLLAAIQAGGLIFILGRPTKL